MPKATATPLPFNLLRAMDAVCDTFDSAWDEGQRPEIDRFLPQVEEAVRPLLLEELVRTDMEWRCRRGEQPSIQEYSGRYPGLHDRLENWLAEAKSSTQPWNPAPGTVFPDSTPEPTVVSATNRPTILGEYELLELLGRGGMGEVWKARHRRLDKLVALKRLLSSNLLGDTGGRARFLQEIRAVGRLEHPNLIEAHDAGEHEGTVYLVMKLVQGQDLARLLREHGALQVSQACDLMRQTALGLQYLHDHGLVHRDLKPSNLICTPAGTVQILDFGLARLRLDGSTDNLTTDGQIMGTPDYVAPEQIGGAATVDIRADLYSLGATLFHLLAGRPPFADREGMWPKLYAHREEAPPKLRQLRPEVPVALEELVARLLAKRPEDRPQTPAEVAAALTPFTTTPAPPPPEKKGPSRRLFIAAGSAALAAIILFGVIWVYSRRPEENRNGRPHPTDANLARQAEGLLKQDCYRCHGQDGRAEGGFGFSGARDRLVKERLVVPGKPAESPLFQKVADGTMPKKTDQGENLPPFHDNGKDILENWIAAGAPDWVEVKPVRPFISNRDIDSFILGDLEKKVAERDRQFVRYFTITHLYNAGLVDEELLSYRVGLSKLVNSLSWNNTITKPAPIDPNQTIFRIDLRDYDWDAEVWKTILASTPYSVIDKVASATYKTYTGTPLPLLRADWFVFAASRPPLYHSVLRLPETDGELEKKLEVDVLKNIKSERVSRVGFNRSGVSQNNRLIERHKSPYGAYWKSYDFASNVDRKDLFTHPFGPGTREQLFQQDSGEILFNLPNGLQAYLLVNGAGKRIDRGPTSIVSDPAQPDKAVLNGISCMRCHAQGMIPKEDQIRARVEASRSAFSKEEYDLLLALYPPADTLAEKFVEDTKRFREAVAKTGAHLSETEPVFALARQFEKEIDLKLAAAEVGVPEEVLRKALDDVPELARAVGELKVGTMKRDKFVASFRLIVSKIPEVGQPFDPGPPPPSLPPPSPPPPPKPGDRVMVHVAAMGYKDQSREQSEDFPLLAVGTKGKVVMIDKVRELCQIQLDKPEGAEVWVALSNVKVTEE